MAINQHPRENMLAEAIAFQRRLLIRLDGPRVPSELEVFIGIRNSGGWSIYFGQDPVYHFTATNCLRRAFVSHQRFESLSRRIWLLGRHSLGGKVQFARQQLDNGNEQALLGNCQMNLHRTWQAMKSGQFELLGSFPDEDELLVSDACRLLAETASGFQLADSPNA